MFIKRRRKFYSIDEVHIMVSQMEQKSKRMPEIIGFRSSDTCKNFKDLLTLCNSLSIVFIQYDLIQDCLQILKSAGEADSNLCKYGTVLDKLWQGRILTYNNLAFLYHKVNQPGDSLKFLYEAHGLAQNIKESGGVAKYDLQVSSNILTFITLWKLKRYQQATTYAELASDNLNAISNGKKSTSFTEENIQNLFSILGICMAGLAVKTEGSVKKAQMILEDCLSQIDDERHAAKTMIRDQMRELYRMRNMSISALNGSNSEMSIETHSEDDFLPKIPSEVLRTSLKQNYDWLITKDFETIFFITCFVPFIAPNTPMIKTSDLENARGKVQQDELLEISNPIKELPQEFESELESNTGLPRLRGFSKFKKVSRSKMTAYRKQSAIDNKSPPRSQAWYEKRIDSRFPSEPRGSGYSNRPILPRLSTPYKGEVLSRGYDAVKRPKEYKNQHIMLEFNPMSGDNVPVELVPMPPGKNNDLYKTRQLDSYYMDICD
ncbi:hypothetical protein SteCoe_16536 [Stentor coeruleus]|uniref:Uncharacterized protein n=1 Tax=Stentor coeruleus TaxID=5963 RepID=A0A1R2C148_9CILI|nr:hypothetical protein SteCoe_16536 [Stentor coeruleus]